MKKKNVLAAMLAAALLSQPALAADAPEVPTFAPTGPWEIDYEGTTCVISRRFAAGADAMQLEILRGGPYVDLRLTGAKLRTGDSARTVAAGFGPGAAAFNEQSPRIGRTEEGVPQLTLNIVPLQSDWIVWSKVDGQRSYSLRDPDRAEVAAALDRVRELQVEQGKHALMLRHGSLKAPLAELAHCRQQKAMELEQELGGPIPNGQAVPIGDFREWLKSEDFPKGVLMRGDSSSIRFRLIVGTDGKPEKCTLLVHDGDEDFRAATCTKLMQRARFKPTLDAEGKPVRNVYVNTVRWVNQTR